MENFEKKSESDQYIEFFHESERKRKHIRAFYHLNLMIWYWIFYLWGSIKTLATF